MGSLNEEYQIILIMIQLSSFCTSYAEAFRPSNARHHLAARCDQRRRVLEVAAQVHGDVREWQECQAQEALTPSQSPSP